ncbi:MAG: HAMP domain-containing sensor histidine kinase [Myxococcota bacterium]
MRRLYLQVYGMVVAILVVFTILVAVGWNAFGPARDEGRQFFRGVASVLARVLPPVDAPREAAQASLDLLARELGFDLTLRSADGGLIANAGPELAAPDANELGSDRVHRRNAFVIPLPDGRTLVAHREHEHFGWLFAIAALAAAIALCAYPLTRRITRRLEKLGAQVEALGSGDLSARVEVRGADEIAELAKSFNRAASQIEQLVANQRSQLASASHELRSPLARIRVAIELLGGEEGAELRARVARDIGELDDLVGELLLASRLEALEPGRALDRRETIDLLGLVAEEASGSGASVDGEAVSLVGDRTLLRRLVRNLLENARRHGNGSAVEFTVAKLGPGRARLRVSDRGPGVPESERERIFAPFYRPSGASETRDGSFGLGLALVRQIARHHGGEARCQAREGGGTVFEVDLGGVP